MLLTRKSRRKRNEKIKNEAIELFIATGQTNQTFLNLDGATTQAAWRERKLRIKECKQFRFECYCMFCGTYAVHWLQQRKGLGRLIIRRGCKRECINCQKKWSQK